MESSHLNKILLLHAFSVALLIPSFREGVRLLLIDEADILDPLFLTITEYQLRKVITCGRAFFGIDSAQN